MGRDIPQMIIAQMKLRVVVLAPDMVAMGDNHIPESQVVSLMAILTNRKT
jgi:hypothetical protein